MKGYVSNLDPASGADAQFVIDAYHRLFQIEKCFRMSKHDPQARPIYHHKRESIEAHLTIVFAVAISRWPLARGPPGRSWSTLMTLI